MAAEPGLGPGVPGRVSVVVPSHDHAALVVQAVDSALAQTYRDVEVVVVDDGSTDGSAQLLRDRYGDRILLLVQDNRGLQVARNVGIRASTGEFVMLLDSDDVLAPTAVTSRRAHAGPGVGAVTGWYREIGLDGALLPRLPQRRRVRPGGQLYQVVRRNYGPPVGWLLRREALETCGLFDPGLPSCDDWDLLVRIAARYAVAYDPTVGGYYRQVPGSMSRSHLVMYDTADAMLRKNATLAPSVTRYRCAAALGRFQHRRRILWNCLAEGSPAQRCRTVGTVVAARPALLVTGALSLLTLLGGKRPDSARRRSTRS